MRCDAMRCDVVWCARAQRVPAHGGMGMGMGMGLGGKRDGGYPYGSPLVFFKIREFIICMHTYINNMTMYEY